MNNNNPYIIFISLILLVLITLLSLNQCNRLGGQLKSDTIVRIDTVLKVLPNDTVYIKSKAITIFKWKNKPNDTISKEEINDSDMSFVASLDTVIKDTYHLEYIYPENEFSLRVKEKSDTLKTIILDKTIEIEKPKSWYEQTWFTVGTAIVTFFTGILIAK